MTYVSIDASRAISLATMLGPSGRWTGFKNGELLKLATGRFDVFVTLDGNLPYQQRNDRTQIAIVILKARTSRLLDVRLLAPDLLPALPQMVPGTIKLIGN